MPGCGIHGGHKSREAKREPTVGGPNNSIKMDEKYSKFVEVTAQ